MVQVAGAFSSRPDVRFRSVPATWNSWRSSLPSSIAPAGQRERLAAVAEPKEGVASALQQIARQPGAGPPAALVGLLRVYNADTMSWQFTTSTNGSTFLMDGMSYEAGFSLVHVIQGRELVKLLCDVP